MKRALKAKRFAVVHAKCADVERRQIDVDLTQPKTACGKCVPIRSIQARLRTKGYKLVDLAWTETQQDWLDRLSAEARAARLDSDAWRPTG